METNILHTVRMTTFGQPKLTSPIFSESGDNESNVDFWPTQSKLYWHNYIESICESLKTNINYLRVATETSIDIYLAYFISRISLTSFTCLDFCDDFNQTKDGLRWTIPNHFTAKKCSKTSFILKEKFYAFITGEKRNIVNMEENDNLKFNASTE